MVPASPAPRRAAGREEVAARSSKKWPATFGEVLWGARFVALVLPCLINKSVGKSKGQS